MRTAALPALLLTALLVLATTAATLADDAEKAPERPIVVLRTGSGEIVLELFSDQAPKTVKNFIDLAEGRKAFRDAKTSKQVKRPFFDALRFHRIIAGFMIQGGCPKGDGTGDPGYFFEDEINAKHLGLDKEKLFPDPATGQPHPYILGILNPRDPQTDFQQKVILPLLGKLKIPLPEANARVEEWRPKMLALNLMQVYENQGYVYSDTLKSTAPKRGMMAMANSGPKTNGSQFFILVDDKPYLGGKHTVFGRVTEGMALVDALSEVKTTPDGKPLEPVIIESIRLKK